MSANAPYEGREFHNLDGVPAGGRLRDLLRWKLLGSGGVAWPTHPPSAPLPAPDPSQLAPGDFTATFVGHSTFLLQFPGEIHVLTDPIWSDRASPFSFAGPKRARPPAVAFDTLPPIDVVLVSHGHFDHLDLPTLRRLEQRCSPLFLTGLGNRAFLLKCGLRNVVELAWWQSYSASTAHGSLDVTFTPAQHWSARSFARRNRTLWGGFFLRAATAGTKVFFAGDTGLGRHFALIQERLGTPDVAFLPIGAYEPRWFMRPQHMNPADAVEAYLTLGAPRSVGMHFGTFRLTDEGIDQPAADLAASCAAHGVPAERFVVPRFGETLRFAV